MLEIYVPAELIHCQRCRRLENMNEEVSVTIAWTAYRFGYRGVCESLNLAEQRVFDIPCQDIGIESHRKKGSRSLLGLDGGLKEWLIPYRSCDCRGIVAVFLRDRRHPGTETVAQQTGKTAMHNGRRLLPLKTDIVVSETEVAAEHLTPLCHKMGSSFN